MTSLHIALCTLFAAAPAPAPTDARPEPLVVVSTGRLMVLGNRDELRAHLEKATKLVADALKKDSLRKAAKKALVEELLGNALSRLGNASELLGFEPEKPEAQWIPKEGREEDGRLADAAVSRHLVVSDLDTLWWELGRADFNLSRAGAEADKPDLRDLIEQARGEASVARSALAKLTDSGAPAPAAQPPATASAPPAPFKPAFAPSFPPAPQAMPEQSFQALLAVLDRESFADDRLRVLETAASSQRFLGEQVVELLTRFPFSAHKLRAVRMLKDRLVDKGHEFQLYAAFTFESDKAALKKMLDGGELEAPRPIDNDDLDQLVAKLKKGFATQVGHQNPARRGRSALVRHRPGHAPAGRLSHLRRPSARPAAPALAHPRPRGLAAAGAPVRDDGRPGPASRTLRPGTLTWTSSSRWHGSRSWARSWW
ncbi:MAG: DUF4476 domain-containing protein [Myxococcales bacterium]